MKTHRIIITRDLASEHHCGGVFLWSDDADPTLDMSLGGIWRRANSPQCSMWAVQFKAIFGFLPAPGTKTVYELHEADPQKGQTDDPSPLH